MNEMPQFAEMPESVRNIMKSSLEQMKKAFDMMMASSQKAMQGFEANPAMTGTGLKALNDKIAEYTKANADANFRHAMKLADARQLSDVVEMQNAHIREMMDSFTKQMEELRELMGNVVKQSAENAKAAMPHIPGMGN
jgi:phasin